MGIVIGVLVLLGLFGLCFGFLALAGRSGMTTVFLVVGVLLAAAVPLGMYMEAALSGRVTALDRLFGLIEGLLYKAFGIDPDAPMGFRTYGRAILWTNLVLGLVCYAIFLLQGILPLNPDGMAGTFLGSRAPYHRVLRHQHQPAALQRPGAAVVLQPARGDRDPAGRHACGRSRRPARDPAWVDGRRQGGSGEETSGAIATSATTSSTRPEA